MSGLRVIPTWRHGQERLYVCLTDGRNVAWYDREAARVNLLSEDRRDDVLEVLGPFLTGPVAVGPTLDRGRCGLWSPVRPDGCGRRPGRS